ncbi:MAG: EAL domain-containing protein [Cycloclasticus sp.]
MNLAETINFDEKPKILIVDDVPSNLLVLKGILEDLDAEVHQASGGNEALTLALDHDFALILLDIHMPNMDGYEVAVHLRSYVRTQKVPIIFVTAIFKEEEYKQKGYDVGAVDYLEKPVNPDYLLAKVNVFLELHQQKQALQNQQHKTEITLSAIPDPVITVIGNRIVYMNETATSLAQVFGHTKPCKSLVELFIFSPENLKQIQKIVAESSQLPPEQAHAVELTFASPKSSNNYVYEFRVVPLRGKSASTEETVLIFHDISSLRSLSQEMAYQAFHDPLTTCPNRRFFEDRLKSAASRYERNKNHLAIMLIGLDSFKQLNDSAGRDVGDKILRMVTERLKTALRDSETLCRLGSDEFSILFEDIDDIDMLKLPAERILGLLSEPFNINNEEYKVSASIGITSTNLGPNIHPTSMLSDADLALCEAKKQGGNRTAFFDLSMRESLNQKIRLDKELIQAITDSQFCLYYQPQVDVHSGKIIGMEALIRWHHPEKNLVPPLDFLPTLESTGLIKEVGAWVIKEACQQAEQWQQEGLEVPCISVNVSAKQFTEKGLPDYVKATLSEHGLTPDKLGIEITETLFMESTMQVENNLRELHDMGCEISLDDFGTGYSALSYLLRFPIDVIKIDQVFIHSLLTQPQYKDMVSAIIHMAHGFSKMKVLCEGVENVSELAILNEMKCDTYQGYLYSKPLPANEMKQLLLNEQQTG